jgi:hypothetical protein
MSGLALRQRFGPSPQDTDAQMRSRRRAFRRTDFVAGPALLERTAFDCPLPLARLGRLAKTGLLSLLFWRRFQVLKDFAEKKERRRPKAHEDGKPLGPGLRILV